MQAQGFGQMVAISSLVGKFGFLRSSYAASKHALHGFETLHLENFDKGYGIHRQSG